MPEDSKILSNDEIRKLNQQYGFSMDESGREVYMISFLVNAEQNHAGDPRPFKVSKQFMPKLVKTAVGRLWLPGKEGQKLHFRDEKNTAESILEKQKNEAGGQMVYSFTNEDTGNASVIIRVFPEYRQAVLEGKIKPAVSPMIGNWKENEQGEIIDGEIIHVHSVDEGGYGDVAKIYGVCDGDFDKCARELIPLAAAGKLNEWRNNSCPCPKKFLNSSQPLGASEMSQGTSAPSIETVAKDLDATKQEIVSIRQEVSSLSTKMDAIAAKVGADAADDAAGGAMPGAKPPVAAAKGGEQMVPLSMIEEIKAQTQKDLDVIKKQLKEKEEAQAKKDADVAAKERRRQAETIVKLELIQRKITPDKKEEAVKNYFEMKDSSNPEQLRDLSLLSEIAEKEIEKILPGATEQPLAAYGASQDDYGLTGDHAPDFNKIESSITGDSD